MATLGKTASCIAKCKNCTGEKMRSVVTTYLLLFAFFLFVRAKVLMANRESPSAKVRIASTAGLNAMDGQLEERKAVNPKICVGYLSQTGISQ